MSLIFEEEEEQFTEVITINKYEITSILRERTIELRNGAESTLPPDLLKDIFDEQRIAELEIEHGVCPVGVKKRVRGGKYETIYIRGNELIVTG